MRGSKGTEAKHMYSNTHKHNHHSILSQAASHLRGSTTEHAPPPNGPDRTSLLCPVRSPH